MTIECSLISLHGGVGLGAVERMSDVVGDALMDHLGGSVTVNGYNQVAVEGN